MFTNIQEFKETFLKKLEMTHGTSFGESSKREQFQTLGQMIREYVSLNWIKTNEQYRTSGNKQVYYLSIEFLLGRLLRHNLMNLGIEQVVSEGLNELGIDLSELEEIEADAGLGNGGLGRLAACFLDSLSSLSLAGHGCGIRYKHGLFEQKIVDGYQVELPEQWLRHGHVWEVRKADDAVEIPFWGRVEGYEENGRLCFRHLSTETVTAVPYDLPVIGHQSETVNTLRLWSAEPSSHIVDVDVLTYKRETESISEMLYPDDTHDEGKILRLKQQYLLVSASLKSIIRSYKKQNRNMRDFNHHVGIHINDTHPALAVPELMRILVDEEGINWDEAWNITVQTLSYTNHTTLSEALETWPIQIFKPLLPRIYMIIEEINERFCQQLWDKYPGDWARIEEMAIIAHDRVKMAPLAIIGSHSVNGVAKLHTEILKTREMTNFYQIYPERFNNKTNGITHRRWLMKANPQLSNLITDSIGPEWIENTEHLEDLLKYKDDSTFLQSLADIKRTNKEKLAGIIFEKTGIKVDTTSVFDVQVKRLHAYKRQLLNVLHIMHLYNRLKMDRDDAFIPRTFIFGAKASPGYYFAKKVIKLINTVAEKINNDPEVHDKIKVVFLENYRVSLAEDIFPAADVSEQISTASKEASGTGNMKFMMNGALTVGTLDGANVEITELVGEENIFLFGLTAEKVLDYQRNGGYESREYYHYDRRIRLVTDQLINGFFPDTEGEFTAIYDSLLDHNDQYFVLRDFSSYVDIQNKISREYENQQIWLEKSLMNIAKSGFFSSDRTIREYANEIWNIKPTYIK
ncbi:glycogen/starch/alpha-glucan phosphorylase [Bacillus sp. B15-48]|uniref:glycogen/starch/alpha-glucan phosphorylase n=1 Tax=Bacillus sp. B15-48 TaxID=1548601 RepID=UPI00193EF226|nr:glycogen/starch/alpha-glucan phosphorylase [Bacillus sp. B15-48]MBM4762667.1 glycogen/starch/alpha-glucan family phosphorylase [Bacillus sp. B15-48]